MSLASSSMAALRRACISQTVVRGVRSIHIQRRASTRPVVPSALKPTSTVTQVRWSSSKSLADEKIEEITELFATAKDEFEIAMEETEKATVYAEDDRAAAREELDKTLAAFKEVVEGADKELAEEVQRRIGTRIRELEQGVKAMEELALHQD